VARHAAPAQTVSLPKPGDLRRWLTGVVAGAAPATDPAAAAHVQLQAGNQLLEAGQLQAAALRYKAALALQPTSVAALVNLGFVLLQVGQRQQALKHLLEALQTDSEHIDALYMAAQIELQDGDAPSARNLMLRLLGKQPSFTLAYPILCRALALTGESAQAMSWLKRGLDLDPQVAELHQIKGNLELESRQFTAAVSSYEKALELAAPSAETHANLGAAWAGLGDLQAAARSLQEALRLRPATAQSCEHLGGALQDVGLLQDAVAAFRRAVELAPDRPSAHRGLGLALHHQGQLQIALPTLQRAVALAPLAAQAHHDLATVQQALGETAAALDSLRRAQALEPTYAPAFSAMATILVELGDYTHALALFERALQLDPTLSEARSQQLFVLSFNSDPAQYLQNARAYGDLVTRQATPYSHAAAPLVDRQLLRVGLVSGDLRTHPVGFFLESVLEQLAAFKIEVVGFPTQAEQDDTTQRLKKHCVEWCPLVGMNDERAASRIHTAQVQVLVDLSGHTAYNRLPVFAWRPAPVQLSWLGYFASTGVPAIGHVLADRVCVPPDQRDHFSEEVVYLPQTRLCFTAPRQDMEVAPLPALTRGWVTLGCYQNLNKLNPPVLALWGRVMAALPQSRLRLQNRQTASPQQRQQLMDRLLAAGLPHDRITLAAPGRRSDYLASYAEVDFMLDTFPYPGGTTTCEALWMGVPTLTLAGHTMLSRQGQALLGAAGLHDWVAADEDHFVELAKAKAQDLPELSRLRTALRQQVAASPLFDAKSFAQDWAQALWALWKTHAKAH
jgi:predicted O-linked N-acetylglucosamine transferase (SPINDLY family)